MTNDLLPSNRQGPEMGLPRRPKKITLHSLTTHVGRLSCATLFVLLLCSTCQNASAGWHSWYKYENAYFEAYSDAPEKQVRALLGELEDFRAAVAQVLRIKIPPGAVKTQVIIFRYKKEFRKPIPDELVSGITIVVRGVPFIVMPARKVDASSKVIIRHEYTHVLMAYSPQRLPAWYKEGFAEFMSATNFQDNGARFTLGEWPQRPRAPKKLLPWGNLVSDDFDPNAITSRYDGSNAYLQCWLLVHYLSLGDELRNHRKLVTYLERYGNGDSSTEAFESVFNSTPDEIGELLDDYSKNTPYYVIEFKPGIQDHDFVREEADAAFIQDMINNIREAHQEAE